MTNPDVRALDFAGKDGVRLRADELGDPCASPVVLLHGGGQTRHAWGSTQAVLAERGWHAVRVDLRGHGDSEWPEDGDYSADAFAADVYALAQALPEQPVLVGASLGGIASLLAIGTHSHPVARGLVLVDVAPKVERAGARRIGRFMTEHMHDGFASLEEVADAVAAYNPHRPRPSDLSGLAKNVRQRADGRWVWHWDPRLMDGNRGSRDETRTSVVDETQLRHAARQVTVPTLLVRGRVSDLLSEEGAQDLLQLVPHAEYVDVDGAGHMVAGDKNDLFNGAIVDFLDRLR